MSRLSLAGRAALIVVLALASSCGDAATGPSVSAISVFPSQHTLEVGETVLFEATVLDVDGEELDDATVTWSSSNISVATVNGSGLVTGVAEGGPVTITASAGGESATASVTVIDAGFSLGVPTSVSVAAGSAANVPITVTRVGGFSGSIVLSAAGLPTGVTASFSNLVVDGSETGSTLTLTAATTAAAGTTDIDVRGTATGTPMVTVSLEVEVTPSTVEWSALAQGFNDDVRALAVSNGQLYAGGFFDTTGTTQVRGIARWNAGSWEPLGVGIHGNVNAIAEWGTSGIYVGGVFDSAGTVKTRSVARYSGGTWHVMDTVSGGFSQINAIAGSGSNLYVGGDFENINGVPALNIARWDGTEWHAMLGGITGDIGENPVVHSIAIAPNGDVYVGGDFRYAGGVPASGIARWDGAGWSAVGGGVTSGNNTVNAVAISVNDIYIGGNFDEVGGVAAKRVAKWNGVSWSPLGTGMNFNVFTLAVSPKSATDIFAGGAFSTAGGASASHVALWNGSSWSSLGSGVDNWVHAITVMPGVDPATATMAVGGEFFNAGGSPAKRIATVSP